MKRCAEKKVSIIAHDLAGGGMTRAYALAQALLYVGYRVEVVGIRLTDSPIYPEPPDNVTVLEACGCCFIHSAWRLLNLLDGDILYAVKPRPSSFGVAIVKRVLTGRRLVLDIDDWEPGLAQTSFGSDSDLAVRQHFLRRGMSLLKAQWRRAVSLRRWLNPADRRYIRWLERSAGRADAITVNTRFLQRRYGGNYVPHCKDTRKYDPAIYDSGSSRELYGLASYTVLMFPGTPRLHKGLEDLLQAMQLLGRRDLRLVLVGGRHSSNEYIDTLISRWGEWIVRMPPFPAEAMPHVVSAAHAVVVPQRDTSAACAQFPMKLTDAMSMAKPVLATTVGDIPEILGETGYLAQPSSPAKLAAALTSILDNPEVAEERARKARERFESVFSLGVVGPMLARVIEGS